MVLFYHSSQSFITRWSCEHHFFILVWLELADPVAKSRKSFHFIIVNHDIKVVTLSTILITKMIIIIVVIRVLMIINVEISIFFQDIFKSAVILSRTPFVHDIHSTILALAFELLRRTLKEPSTANFNISIIFEMLYWSVFILCG